MKDKTANLLIKIAFIFMVIGGVLYVPLNTYPPEYKFIGQIGSLMFLIPILVAILLNWETIKMCSRKG